MDEKSLNENVVVPEKGANPELVGTFVSSVMCEVERLVIVLLKNFSSLHNIYYRNQSYKNNNQSQLLSILKIVRQKRIFSLNLRFISL